MRLAGCCTAKVFFASSVQAAEFFTSGDRKDFGGAKRDRTADLLHAMQALSQLSYSPIRVRLAVREDREARCARRVRLITSASADGKPKSEGRDELFFGSGRMLRCRSRSTDGRFRAPLKTLAGRHAGADPPASPVCSDVVVLVGNAMMSLMVVRHRLRRRSGGGVVVVTLDLDIVVAEIRQIVAARGFVGPLPRARRGSTSVFSVSTSLTSSSSSFSSTLATEVSSKKDSG